MVTDKMVEAFKIEFHKNENENLDYDARLRVSLEAALSTDAEPLAWLPTRRWEKMTAAEPWLTNIVYSEDQAKLFPCIPLYGRPQQTAPSVAVKGVKEAAQTFWNNEPCSFENEQESYFKGFYSGAYWQRHSLSAQVQDMAEVSPTDYMRRHDAAIAAYEANNPLDYRYSALALRKAVDAAFAVAATPAAKMEYDV